MSNSVWYFVDDQISDAQSYAEEISRASGLSVTVISPNEARESILTGAVRPLGVLLDVDISNAKGERGTGLGLAQDIRAKQREGKIPEFPAIRFAGAGPIAMAVGGDPSSDDLFDLRIPKEIIRDGNDGVSKIATALSGVELVYDALKRLQLPEGGDLSAGFGITPETWEKWGHSGFADRLASSLDVSVHVAAGAYLRTFLLAPGLVIDQTLLGVRLGVDITASGAAWEKFVTYLPFRYTGIADANFPRWWAKGLDQWWLEQLKQAVPLSATDIETRVATLNASLGIELHALTMPQQSAGNRPWRLCQLSLEKQPPITVPVDPSEAVRITPRVDLPAWIDPQYAAFGIATQAPRDFRRNRSDMERLKRKYRV